MLAAGRLWAVQNTNQVARIRLRPHLTSGVAEKVITSDLFQVPATAARFGSRLAVVNAKFDTGIPPTADQYEVVLVDWVHAVRRRGARRAPSVRTGSEKWQMLLAPPRAWDSGAHRAAAVRKRTFAPQFRAAIPQIPHGSTPR